VLADFAAAGATLVVVSPQRPELGREMIERHRLGFELLTDARNAVAARFGLRFPVSPEVRAIYLGFGVDLAKANGDDSWTLPMPARYVIDRDGVIRDAQVDPDYTRRPEPSETVAVVRALGG
jgi:peroxiredoxin